MERAWLICLIGALIAAVSADASDFEAPLPDYADLSARWWELFSSLPMDMDPLAGEGDVDCTSFQPDESVVFLAGNSGGVSNRRCAIPEDTPVFFPIANFVTTLPEKDWPLPEKQKLVFETLSDVVAGEVGTEACELEATIDGLPVQFFTPVAFVVSRPLRLGRVGKEEVNDAQAVASGFWVYLFPGEAGPHTLQFRGKICQFGQPEDVVFNLDVTYILDVLPDDDFDR